jgi:hypothetical protein
LLLKAKLPAAATAVTAATLFIILLKLPPSQQVGKEAPQIVIFCNYADSKNKNETKQIINNI